MRIICYRFNFHFFFFKLYSLSVTFVNSTLHCRFRIRVRSTPWKIRTDLINQYNNLIQNYVSEPPPPGDFLKTTQMRCFIATCSLKLIASISHSHTEPLIIHDISAICQFRFHESSGTAIRKHTLPADVIMQHQINATCIRHY